MTMFTHSRSFFMRRTIIAGNWKMNTDLNGAATLASAVVDGLAGHPSFDEVEVVLCPPSIWLPVVAEKLGGSQVKLGAQNVSHENDGAYTGEISTAMLKSVGCKYSIVGHSERRTMYAESDGVVADKAKAVFNAGLTPIVCIGETLSERESGEYGQVISEQLNAIMAGVLGSSIAKYVIAYEPIWAIGTGRNATPEQAQEVHALIRSKIAREYDDEVANAVPIIYGGSVKPDNAAELMAQPDIDGALVGGASLDAEGFLKIVSAAR
jgi:triosephosphate isomerase